MHATYNGGNVATITMTVQHDGLTLEQAQAHVTMTELRAMMDKLEAEYRTQSCCPGCGTLTLDGSMCADCVRYEESANTCAHAVYVGAYCPQCEEIEEAAALAELGL